MGSRKEEIVMAAMELAVVNIFWTHFLKNCS